MPVSISWAFQNWQNFYLLTAAASATLVGLLFVSLNLSIGLIQGDTDKIFRIWAEPTLNDFVQVLALSALAEMPVIPSGLYAILLLLYTLWRSLRLWEVGAYFAGPESPSDIELADWISLVILPALGYAAALASCVGLWLGSDWAAATLAAYVLGILMLGISNTWSQVVWIAGEKNKREVKAPSPAEDPPKN
jgi:hypothetical protein